MASFSGPSRLDRFPQLRENRALDCLGETVSRLPLSQGGLSDYELWVFKELEQFFLSDIFVNCEKESPQI